MLQKLCFSMLSLSMGATAIAGGVQQNPDDSLDRIDQIGSVLDNQFSYAYSGQGVNIYVIDKGVFSSHSDFNGDVVNSVTFENGFAQLTSSSCEHGTNVASVAAGDEYGAAKDAKIYSVKIYDDCDDDGELPVSYLQNAFNWVANNAQQPAVAVVSSGWWRHTHLAIESSIQNVINNGIPVIVAGGNRAAFAGVSNSCLITPSAMSDVISVGNVYLHGGTTDSFYPDSMEGSCIDILAPGSSVLTASNASSTASTRNTGTSISAAFVAGVAAMVRDRNPFKTPQQVKDEILCSADNASISFLPSGTTNKILNTPKSSCQSTTHTIATNHSVDSACTWTRVFTGNPNWGVWPNYADALLCYGKSFGYKQVQGSNCSINANSSAQINALDSGNSLSCNNYKITIK